jgi:hypothetical protein
MANTPVAFYGFTSVPRDPDVLFKDHPSASGPNPKQDLFSAADFPLPDSELVRQVRQFVKTELNEQTYNHSHRVYVYGTFLLSAFIWEDENLNRRRTQAPRWCARTSQNGSTTTKHTFSPASYMISAQQSVSSPPRRCLLNSKGRLLRAT